MLHEVLTLKPGRKFDVLVVKEIFNVSDPDLSWSPSTDISAAFEVIEEMKKEFGGNVTNTNAGGYLFKY